MVHNKLQFIFLAVVLGMANGCVTTSPPLTMQIGKMPEILRVKEKEVQLAYGLVNDRSGIIGMTSLWQGQVSYGFKEQWQLDIGALLTERTDNDSPESVMTTVGAKYGFLAHKRWSAAVPFAIGLGCGGYNGDDLGTSDTTDDIDSTFKCSDGFAYGAYSGVDFGYRFGKVVGIYQGNRLQFSKAAGLPSTILGLHMLGLQFDLGKKLYLSVEGGPAWFSNSENSDLYGKGSGAIGFHW